jgi:hypothetical protein
VDPNERLTYVLEGARGEAPTAWSAILDALEPIVGSLCTDLFPSPDWPNFDSLPEQTRLARSRLVELATGKSATTFMAVDVPVSEEGLRLVREWGSYSIHTQLSRPNGTVLLIAHDQGESIHADLTVDEAELVRRRLSSAGVRGRWELLPQRPKRWRFRRSRDK